MKIQIIYYFCETSSKHNNMNKHDNFQAKTKVGGCQGKFIIGCLVFKKIYTNIFTIEWIIDFRSTNLRICVNDLVVCIAILSVY